MKSVLISIQPKYVELIASGKKTIEVRKTRPKLEIPFKCYIYCTKGKPTIFESGGLVNDDIPYFYNGYVMGEFVCRGMMDGGSRLLPKQSCLTIDEILDYSKGKRVYGWRIADLKIYDKPKELSEFSTYGYNSEYTVKDGSNYSRVIVNPLKRPPRSWCYVEV